MIANTDHFSIIGSSHEVCEDYIISGHYPFAYVILADGCTGSPDTDIGARVLCLLAKDYLLTYFGSDIYVDDMANTLIAQAELVTSLLHISPQALDATLMVAYVDIDDNVCVYMHGDGNIIAKRKDNTMRLINVKVDKNMPYYLTYIADRNRAQQHDDLNLVKHYKDTDNVGGWDCPTQMKPSTPISLTFSANDYDTVLISSDGIESFELDLPFIAASLCDFKTTGKRYIKKRTRKVIRSLKKQDQTHYDDISIGGFFFESLGDILKEKK